MLKSASVYGLLTSTAFSPVNIASNRSVLQQDFSHLLIMIADACNFAAMRTLCCIKYGAELQLADALRSVLDEGSLARLFRQSVRVYSVQGVALVLPPGAAALQWFTVP